jgi:uncharacterized coiled-coil protein SlyX
VGVSYGTTQNRVGNLEERVAVLEARTLSQLESLNENITKLRVDVGKMSQDINWMKARMVPEKE